jgi:NADH-quinone oxidoreductase subunit F
MIMQQQLFRHNKPGRCVTFDEYRDEGGFAGLTRAIQELTPKQVEHIVSESGLRGRGGAGFPTGKKWSFVPRDTAGSRWLVCNCDEMEPGTYKDRVLLEANPYILLEGMLIASYALGVTHAFIFIRRGYEQAAANLKRGVTECVEAGLLGDDILGSGFSLSIDVHVSAGRYICGEETALLNALEGVRANPRTKPPFPAVKGLWDGPTVVNNAESLANLPAIVMNGAEWFKGLARTPESAGMKLFCISGHVAASGCFELPLGIPLSEIIEEHCGGMRAGSSFKACLPGGASTPFFSAVHYHTPMDFDAVSEAGSRLGTGGIVVFDQNTCMVAATLNLIRFFARESCGWCTPCREGLPYVRHVLETIEAGNGGEEHIDILQEHVKLLNHAFCALAPGAMGPVDGLLTNFMDEVHQHIVGGSCPFR